MAGWAQAANVVIPSVTGWWGSRQKAKASKRAGTTLAEAALGEDPRAYALENRLNPFISQAYTDQMGQLLTTADQAGTGIDTATQAGMAGARGVGREAAGYLDPYMQAGGRSLSTLADLANAPEERFDPNNVPQDPGFAWRLQQGNQALQKSAAARGGLQSGGTLKALANYSQGLASQEYQNAYTRGLDTFKANQLARQDRLKTLAGLSELGSTGAQAAGRFLQTGENFAGELGLRGALGAGDLRTGAARTAGGWGIDSAKGQLGVSLGAEDIARRARLGSAQATAGSQMGVGEVWGDFWGQTGQNLGSWLQTNPFGSGGSGGGSPSSGGYTYDWETGQYKRVP